MKKHKIAGRKDEHTILSNLLISKSSEFVAVYGRRRVGKSFLIDYTYKKNIVFECSGMFGNNKLEQLENFALNLSKKNKKKLTSFNNWIQAFNALENYILSMPKTKKKKVIFLDEISWFDTPKSGFIGALSNFWNMFCVKRNDIVLVICGSAASWIINKIINARGGLHNRLTRTIVINPFTFAESLEFLKLRKVKLSVQSALQLYMCIGGIPYYLNFVENGYSVAQVLDMLFFKKNAQLRNEFQNLYAALFRNHSNHLSVIKALSSKNKGFTRNEIIKATKINSGGALSLILSELEQCGFINTYNDYTKRKEDMIYRLMDEYTLFYLKFMQKHRGQLIGNTLINSNSFKVWSGFAFENFCFKHIHSIVKALGISGIQYANYALYVKNNDEHSGAQIDLIIDRADNCVNLVEIKYYKEAYNLTKVEYTKINKRISVFKNKTQSKKSVFVTLISPMVAIKNAYYHDLISHNITINDFTLE